jgi:hypothetical protein
VAVIVPSAGTSTDTDALCTHSLVCFQSGGTELLMSSPVSIRSKEVSESMASSDISVREHHDRVKDAVSPLCSLDGNSTLLVNDKKGWYVTRENQAQDSEQNDERDGSEEFPKERRARNFCEDYNRVAATRLERTLYTLTSYKFPETFDRWKLARFDPERGDNGEYVYADRKPAPLSEDIAAVAVWGDIDLDDELKLQRPDLDEETYDIAEEAYEAYIQAFADLYGGRDAVYMLDSVGGAYIFGAPEATLPIVRYYADDDDARARVLSELIDRSNDYLGEAQQRINERIDGADEIIDPDWANNINRQYKMPLTLHGDHDAVVTPVDVEDVRYREPIAVEEVDDTLLEDVHEWCESFTAVEFEDRVTDLVADLWPDECDEHGSWEDALDAWVEAERERERRDEQRRQAAAERREQRLDELGEGIEGQPITPFLQDVYDALDGIDTAEVVRHYASDEWDSGADMADKTEFNPSWRSSKSGRSCYVNHSTNRFGDPGESGGGYAAKAMALGKTIITDASQDLTGEEWAEAVDALRDAGYKVPIWTPEKGSHRRDGSEYDEMPFWAVRKAAVALGVLPENGFTTKTGARGKEYLGFPSAETYNTVLDEIEAVGLDHNRDHVGTTKRTDSVPDIDLSADPETTVATDDDELIEKARNASNGENFTALWEGSTDGHESRSKAATALCFHLAFWTGGDADRMDQLFRGSELMWPGWDESIEQNGTGESFGETALKRALAGTDSFYESPQSETDSKEAVASRERDEQRAPTESADESELPTEPATTASDGRASSQEQTEAKQTEAEQTGREHAHLKEQNRLLIERVETLEDDIEQKEARIEKLEAQLAYYEEKLTQSDERERGSKRIVERAVQYFR